MDVKAQLLQSLEDILDRMAFMFYEEPEEEEGVPDDFQLMTGISFSGAINGTLNLFFNQVMAEAMARNLVGIRDEDELFPQTLHDAICEFTNMIMGHTMTNIDSARSFEMDVPHIVTEPSSAQEGMETIQIEGLLDEAPIKLVMHYTTG